MKTFVLDTNVLIHDPDSIFNFKDNAVIIPMTVIEELDSLKKVHDERGQNARLVSRKLDELRSKGRLSEGVRLNNGGMLRIELDHQNKLPYEFVTSKNDHRILGLTLELQKTHENVIFISKDINLRIKGEALGLEVMDYEKSKVKIENLYSGWREINLSPDEIDQFYKEKILKTKKSFFPNEGVLIKDKTGGGKSAVAKYSSKTRSLVPLYHSSPNPWGIKPLNVEQRFAIELLMCNDIDLVTMVGVPGAGKTLLSLACGLQKVFADKTYRKLFIARPVVPMGRDIGYLPGSKEDKLKSWMGAIYDNLEFLLTKFQSNGKGDDVVRQYLDEGRIEIEALTYIRGRSLPNLYIIIDDAQNLTPHEIKTIISRAGNGTKLVLTGDPYQIDNPYLDVSSNGLTYLVEHFKGQEICGHIHFSKTERSALAAMASELL